MLLHFPALTGVALVLALARSLTIGIGAVSLPWSRANEEVSAVQARTKARLAKLKMSLPDLIKKSTLTEETCCDILAGKTVPGIDATASLSKALDTSMDYLVGNSEYSCAIASEDEQDIILRYRQLSKKGKRIFLGMMEKMEEEKTE